jgi:hypothetical protein
MCDQNTYDKIVDAVQQFINRGEAFTAFDVTRILRMAYADFAEPHKVVRNILHERFNSDAVEFLSYDRTDTPLNIGGRVISVLVFHPTGSSASTHPLADKSKDTVTASPIVSDGYSVDSVPLTKDSRLQIPKQLLDIVEDDTVTVKIGAQTTTYTKNKDGRVRVSFINPTKNQYKVSVDPRTQAIVIE